MKNVLLLRAPEEEGPDRYEAEFQKRGYLPLSVPVLETAFVHVDALRDKIVRGPDAQGFSGVILTSKRAVEAWCEALRTTVDATQADWRTVPFYVVGSATAAAASRIQSALPSMVHLAPATTLVRGGADAGTGERLAAFILAESADDRRRRMLYLTGDKNRETLPGMLAKGGVALEMLEVYRTTGSSTFRADLEAVVAKAPADPTRREQWGWVVHFAPSAAASVAPVLRDVFGRDAGDDERSVRVAAIGPTTASHLRDALGVWVDAVASGPTADALCRAVVAADELECRT